MFREVINVVMLVYKPVVDNKDDKIGPRFTVVSYFILYFHSYQVFRVNPKSPVSISHVTPLRAEAVLHFNVQSD